MLPICTFYTPAPVYAWSQRENTGFRQKKYDILLIYVSGDRVENEHWGRVHFRRGEGVPSVKDRYKETNEIMGRRFCLGGKACLADESSYLSYSASRSGLT